MKSLAHQLAQLGMPLPAASGSANIEAASTNETPCFLRFDAAACSGSHVNRTQISVIHFCACGKRLPAPQFGQPLVSTCRAGTGSARTQTDVTTGNFSIVARAFGKACKPATLGSLPETKNPKAPPAKCR